MQGCVHPFALFHKRKSAFCALIAATGEVYRWLLFLGAALIPSELSIGPLTYYFATGFVQLLRLPS